MKKLDSTTDTDSELKEMQEIANSINAMLVKRNQTSVFVNFAGDTDTDLCAFITYMPKKFSFLLMERLEEFQAEFTAEVMRRELTRKNEIDSVINANHNQNKILN